MIDDMIDLILICYRNRDGTGLEYDYNILVISTLRSVIADAPDYFEDIIINHYNPATDQFTSYTIEELGKLCLLYAACTHLLTRDDEQTWRC